MKCHDANREVGRRDDVYFLVGEFSLAFRVLCLDRRVKSYVVIAAVVMH